MQPHQPLRAVWVLLMMVVLFSLPPHIIAQTTQDESPDAFPPMPGIGSTDIPTRPGVDGPSDEVTDDTTDDTTGETQPPVVLPPPPVPQPPVPPVPGGNESAPSLSSFADGFNDGLSTVWAINGWTLQTEETGNGYLATSQPSASAEIQFFKHHNLDINARVRIQHNNTLTIALRDEAATITEFMFDTRSSSRLLQNGQMLQTATATSNAVDAAAAPSQHWYSVTVRIFETAVVVYVDGDPRLITALPQPLNASRVVFKSGAENTGLVYLDDVTVNEQLTVPSTDSIGAPVAVAPVSGIGVVEEPTTPTLQMATDSVREVEAVSSAIAGYPTNWEQLTDTQRAKINGRLADVVQAYVDFDPTFMQNQVESLGLSTDSEGRLHVVIWEAQPRTVADVVTSNGGIITSIEPSRIEAYIPLLSIMRLIANDNVARIGLPAMATSTSPDRPTYAPSDNPLEPQDPSGSGTVYTQGYELTGVQSWHNANIRGSGVRVGIVDIGFNGNLTGSDYACLFSTSERTGAGVGSSNHGLNAIEIVCDMAPESSVYMYRAANYAQLRNAISVARNDNIDVLMILIDVGASESPGDGTGRTGNLSNDPYAQLAQARSEGMVIYAAAGNNEQMTDNLSDVYTHRYTAFFYSGESWQIRAKIEPGEYLNMSWSSDNWANPSNRVSATLTGAGLNETNPTVGFAGHQYDTAGCTPTNGFCEVTLNLQGLTTPAQSVLVQLQVTGNGGLERTGAHRDDTGSLARPADSPDVIAVGAVCPVAENGYPAVPSSSHGPAYGPGGTLNTSVAAPYARSEVKPDIASFSHVNTSLSSNRTTFRNCDGTVAGELSAGGFGGTSAATAHAAAMTALIRSNTANPSFDALLANKNNSAAVDAVRDYVQSHVADLPLGGAANGFDMTYGSGLAMLGLNRHNLFNNINPAIPADADYIGSCNAVHYVGIGSLDGERDGSLASPFVHIGHALASAAANDCVVVNPGDYVTPLYINGLSNNITLASYDDASTSAAAPTLIRVQAQYQMPNWDADGNGGTTSDVFRRNAGVVINNQTGFTISGFNFVRGLLFSNTDLRSPQGIVVNNSPNVTIRRNTLGRVVIPTIAYNGQTIIDTTITYTGWRPATTGKDDDASPLHILNGSHGARVEANIFDSNAYILGGNRFPGLSLVQSGSEANPSLIVDNRFLNNISNDGLVNIWIPVVFVDDSYVDFVTNRFVGNIVQTLVIIATANENAEEEARFFGNIFLNNTTESITTGTSSGPLINLRYVKNFYFLNNTVVLNDMSSSTGGGSVIARGNPQRTAGGITTASLQQWEIHNNIFYNNIVPDNLVTDMISNTGCRSIISYGGGQPIDNRGFQHNWIYRTANPGGDVNGGVCELASNFAANDNITDINPTEQFIGFALEQDPESTINPLTDAVYWALREIDPEASVYAAGIDGGDPAISGGIINVAPFDKDLNGAVRVSDVVGWNDDRGPIDIGAYEFVQLDVQESITPTFTEGLPNPAAPDNPVYTLDLTTLVEGGIGELTFTATQRPLNYGLYCGAEFTDANRGLVIEDGIARYCPPRDFYTDPTPDQSGESSDPTAWRDSVDFVFSVIDEAASSGSGQVTITILPDNADAPLTAVIGDGSPVEDTFTIVDAPGEVIEVALRPYVTFNNFTYSEAANPEFIAGNTRQIEYPFTYNILSINGDPIVANEDDVIGVQDDNLVSFELEPGRTGIAVVNYRVTDKNGNFTDNFLRIETGEGVVEEAGIFDDTSFYFNYFANSGAQGGSWQPATDTRAINQTLHTTTVVNDYAEFGIEATGFVIYMMPHPQGALWELTINGASPDANWTLINDATGTSNATYQTTISNLICTTSAPVSGTLIDNRNISTPYTVTCNGSALLNLRARLFNRGSGGNTTLSVDAFSIIKDDRDNIQDPVDGPFTPGRYDVGDAEFRGIFIPPVDGGGNPVPSPYSEFTYSVFSNGVSFSAEADGSPEFDLTFSIKSATGFAIETVEHPITATSYDICVRRRGAISQTCMNFNNAPLGNSTKLAPNVYRPWWGLDPAREYEVLITNIDGGLFIVDSLVVFGVNEVPAVTAPFVAFDDGDLAYYHLGQVLPNSWRRVADIGNAYQRTLTYPDASKASTAGPFIGMQVPPETDYVLWRHYEYSGNTTQAVVCVDRRLSMSGADQYANCIVVNMQNGSFQQIDPTTGALRAPQPPANDPTPESIIGNLELTNDVLMIAERNFPTIWGDTDRDGLPQATTSPHTIEIFNLVAGTVTPFDGMTVVGVGQPMQPAFYEEHTQSIIRSGNFQYQRDNSANNDSGQSILRTTQNGAFVYFDMYGNGILPYFRLTNDSGNTRVCWMQYDPTEPALEPPPSTNEVRNNGICQTFNNFSGVTWYQAYRLLAGWDLGYYRVVIENVGPGMYFDGVEILNEDWQNAVTQLVPGQRYESDYDDREAFDYFRYYGDNWLTLDNRTDFSANNTDYTSNQPGAGVLFRTNNANAIILYRTTRSGYSPIQVCAALESDQTQRKCTTIDMQQTASIQPFTVMLNDTNNTGPHVVTLMALNSAIYIHDAVEPINTAASPLTVGTYDETEPLIIYNDPSQWVSETGPAYHNGNRLRSTGNGATATFRFEGTGFAIATTTDAHAGEVQVCYGLESPDTCMTYQHETESTADNVLRTVVGLPHDTYVVQLRDVSDDTTLYNRAQDGVGALVLDKLYIFDESQPPTIPSSLEANQDHMLNGQALLSALPVDHWATFTGQQATDASDENYLAVVDAQGNATANRAGATLALTLDLDGATDGTDYTSATVIFYTGVTDQSQPAQWLACVDDVAGDIRYDGNQYTLHNSDTCTLIDAVQPDGRVILNAADLPRLAQPTATDGTDRVLTLRSLTTGAMQIDGVRVLYGPSLAAGYYDERVGFGQSDDAVQDLIELSGAWMLENNTNYDGGYALTTNQNNAALQFRFTGTGFSLVSAFNTLTGGDYTVAINGPVNEQFAGSLALGDGFGASLTYAGLPFGDYTVTITNRNAGKTFALDGLHIYGQLESLGSLYDDARRTLDGNLYLTYGPSSDMWTAVRGPSAINALNETYHVARTYGAAVTFEIGQHEPAGGIIIYYEGSTRSRSVDVCLRDVTNPTSRYCGRYDLSNGDGRVMVSSENPGAAVDSALSLASLPFGHYTVTIINTDFNTLALDAVQVLEDTLAEGIYDVRYLNDINAFTTGTWSLDDAQNRATGLTDAALEFTMTGVAFSVQLADTSTNPETYTICVNRGLTTNNGSTCDTISTSATKPGVDHALTYLGLHDGLDNGTYTVQIRNAGATAMTIESVHVLGANPELRITDAAQIIENNAPQVRVLPFGSLTEQIDESGQVSGISQHVGDQLGAGIYFELQSNVAAGFAYVRELSAHYGDVTICYGQIGQQTSLDAACVDDVTNQVASESADNIYQASRSIVTDATCGGDNGCWVFIQNRQAGRTMTFDYTRLLANGQPLTAGFYEQNAAEIGYEGNWITNFSYAGSSGGTVHYTDTVGGNMGFNFTGTGFSVHFAMNTYASLVDICWLGYDTTPPSNSTVLSSGECLTYDNAQSTVVNAAARTVAGLPPGNYAVAVEMLADASVNPLLMMIDGVSVYNEAWFASDGTDWTNDADLQDLSPGTRYEPSYNNRVTQNQFQFIGTWADSTGNGSDSAQNVVFAAQYGATITFRTRNANAMLLYHRLNRGYASVLVCSAPVDINPLRVVNTKTCQIISTEGSGFQQPVPFYFGSADTGEYVVTISTLSNASYILDAVELFDVTSPLPAGIYPDVSPYINYSGGWASYFIADASSGRVQYSLTPTGQAEFTFTGTGFKLGMPIETFGSNNVQVCYATATNYPNNLECFTYDQADSTRQYLIDRIVVGLPRDSYTVRLSNAAADGLLMLDDITIYDQALPSVVPPGYYNETAQDMNGDLYARLRPFNNWDLLENAGFSGGTVYTVADDLGRTSSSLAGMNAMFVVDVPADQDLTFIFYNTYVSTGNSNTLQVCVVGVDDLYSAGDCINTAALTVDQQLVFDRNTFPELGTPGQQKIVFTSITRGQLPFDAFQVIAGENFGPGIYDEFLPTSLLNFTPSVNRNPGCNTSSNWCILKDSGSFGGFTAYSSSGSASLQFTIEGSGFSILTNASSTGTPIRICYKRSANTSPFPALGSEPNPVNIDLSQTGVNAIWCDDRTTNTASGWSQRNGPQPLPTSPYRYGFSYYGLPVDTYDVEVRVDGTPSGGRFIQIDAVAVFGESSTLPVIQPGFYDDAALNQHLSLGPDVLWSAQTTTDRPPSGPFNQTQTVTTNAGAIAQMKISGNALTLFYRMGSTSSRWANICWITAVDTTIHCTPQAETTNGSVAYSDSRQMSEFSQNNATTNVFVPMAFYGFGEGEHEIIIENRDNGSEFNIDALLVQP